MYENYNGMNYSQNTNNYANVSAFTTYQIMQYNTYEKAFQNVGKFIGKVVRLFKS